MLRTLAALLVFVTLATPAAAEIKLKQEHRTPNFAPGYCVWVCLRTAGLHQGIPKLEPIVRLREAMPGDWYWDEEKNNWEWKYAGIGSPRHAREQLKKMGIEGDVKDDAKADFFRTNLKLGRPVVAGIWHWKGGLHAVLVTEYTEKVVYFLDPNDVSSIYQYPVAEFEKAFTGFAIAVHQ